MYGCIMEILSYKLYGCETWSLAVREECRLRVFGPKRDGVTGTGADFVIKTFLISAPRHMLFWSSHQEDM